MIDIYDDIYRDFINLGVQDHWDSGALEGFATNCVYSSIIEYIGYSSYKYSAYSNRVAMRTELRS